MRFFFIINIKVTLKLDFRCETIKILPLRCDVVALRSWGRYVAHLYKKVQNGGTETK